MKIWSVINGKKNRFDMYIDYEKSYRIGEKKGKYFYKGYFTSYLFSMYRICFLLWGSLKDG